MLGLLNLTSPIKSILRGLGGYFLQVLLSELLRITNLIRLVVVWIAVIGSPDSNTYNKAKLSLDDYADIYVYILILSFKGI